MFTSHSGTISHGLTIETSLIMREDDRLTQICLVDVPLGEKAEGLHAASDLLEIQISGENMHVIVLLSDGR